MKDIIKNSLANSMSYEAYMDLVNKHVEEKSTTGPEQSEMRIDFTKLNASRMRRLNRKTEISEERLAPFAKVPKQTWLVISESWCGDAAQTLPVLNRIAEHSDQIDLKIVLRDEDEALMNQFLTNGAKAIPKVIILDEAMEVQNSWGSRSKEATKLVEDYKAEHGKIDATFKKDLQLWYNKNKGKAIVDDFLEMLQ